MPQTDAPFNKIYFPLTAVNTVNSTATTEIMDYLGKPFRFNNKTADQLKVAALPANESFYKPSVGGVMKVLTVETKDDLDKYFVASLDNAVYASYLEMLTNVSSSARLKIIMLDVEDEVGDGVLPNATDILKAIHDEDDANLAYKKMVKAKSQLHAMGYWLHGFDGLGFGETVDPIIVASITPELLSLSLLDKVDGNDPVVPAEFLPADKAAVLSASVDINYNIQDATLFTFEVLEDGAAVTVADIDPDVVTKIEASDIKVTYTKSNGVSVDVTIASSPLVDETTSTEIHPVAIKVIDFSEAKVTKVAFVDTTIPANITLSTLTAPTSKEYTERFVTKSIFEDTTVHVIVSNEAATLLTNPSDVIAISFVNDEGLNNKFGFIFEEKDKVDVPASVLAYLYVKLAEIKIARGFGTNENTCFTFVEAAAKAAISGTVFTFNATVANPVYDILKAEADGNPINLSRSYESETLAGNVVDLTAQYERQASLGALGAFFSTALNGGLDNTLDIFSGKTTYSDAFTAKIGLPTLEGSTVEDIDLGIKTLAFATPVKLVNGSVPYFWDHPVSLVKTGTVYNTVKESYIKAYSYNALNTIITSALVNLKSRMYSRDVIDNINIALNDALSKINTAFGDQIGMTIRPLVFREGRVNPDIITQEVDGVRVVTLKLTNIATVTINSSLNKFTLSYERTIQA